MESQSVLSKGTRGTSKNFQEHSGLSLVAALGLVLFCDSVGKVDSMRKVIIT